MNRSFPSVRRGAPACLALFVVLIGNVSRGEEAAKSAPDLSTPKKAALTFAKAVDAGDMETARKTCTGTDDQFATIKNMNDMFAAVKRFNAASVAKFGDKGKIPGSGTGEFVEHVESTEEKIDGDKATLIDKKKPDDKYPMALTKAGADWKVDLSSMDPDMVKFAEAAKKFVAAVDAVTKDVEGGKYKTAEEAIAAWMAAQATAF